MTKGYIGSNSATTKLLCDITRLVQVQKSLFVATTSGFKRRRHSLVHLRTCPLTTVVQYRQFLLTSALPFRQKEASNLGYLAVIFFQSEFSELLPNMWFHDLTVWKILITRSGKKTSTHLRLANNNNCVDRPLRVFATWINR